MNSSATFLQCSSCCSLRIYPSISSSVGPRRKCFRRSPPKVCSLSSIKLGFREKRLVACRATSSETETEPESNNDKDKDAGLSPPTSSIAQNNGHLESQSNEQSLSTERLDLEDSVKNNGVDLNSQAGTQETDDNLEVASGSPLPGVKSNEQSLSTERLDLEDSVKNNGVDLNSQAGTQETDDNLEVASGSPLPGVKQLGEPVKIPKATIDILKDQVFGFDTFFITSQEPYEGGVLFKGNLRGQAAKSYEKITKRMQDRFGDQYKLFLLINPEDDRPVAVVVPKKVLQPETTAVPEWFAAAAFGLVTIFTLLLRNVPALQSNLLSTFDNFGLLKDGLAGAFVTASVLGVHEVAHILVANNAGVKLGVPYFVPSWQIGSFGAITRIVSIVPKREDLLKIAVAGPLAGFSVGFVLLLLGFILPPTDGIGIVVDAAVLHESFLVGGIAKLLLGDALKEGTPLSINPLVIWAWAGLLINAINSIPAGELDGGRISFALWGRKASTRVTGISIALLGLASLFNDVAFYWVALIFFLQRGPIAPLSEEITHPENKDIALGVAVLILGLLVCAPYPFPFIDQSMNF